MRTFQADEYGDIRSRQDELFGRPPVGEGVSIPSQVVVEPSEWERLSRPRVEGTTSAWWAASKAVGCTRGDVPSCYYSGTGKCGKLRRCLSIEEHLG